MQSTVNQAFLQSERHFQTGLFCCTVTKQMDKCVRVKLGELPLPDGKLVEIHGNFSETGLQALMQDLQSAPEALTLPTPAQTREGSSYQWGVRYRDGQHLQQYPAEGGETPFSAVHLPNVSEFWIIPHFDPDGLPWYGLIEGHGFVVAKRYQLNEPQPLTRFGVNGVEELLPFPTDPYEIQYYRKVTLTFGQYSAGKDSDTHIVQVLGWRLGEEIFTICIEDSGDWQVWENTIGT
jgi:hypothetical protein